MGHQVIFVYMDLRRRLERLKAAVRQAEDENLKDEVNVQVTVRALTGNVVFGPEEVKGAHTIAKFLFRSFGEASGPKLELWLGHHVLRGDQTFSRIWSDSKTPL